jgi:hypothetical protein
MGFALLCVMAIVAVGSGCDVPSLPLFGRHYHTYHGWVLLVTPAPPWHPGQS